MRRSTPRTKSGCSTCRIRRVKCDETKPSCIRCTSTGRKCDGYTTAANKTSPTTLGPPERLAADAGRSPSALVPITSYSIPFRIPGSQRDRQLLHYFCVQGSNQISGFIKHDFWSRTALLASQDEPIVRQSLIALSSLHLDLSSTAYPGTEVVSKETLSRYGKALRALQSRISSTDAMMKATTRTALICCILFHCFEVSLGDGEAALSHLSNGLGLLAAHHRHEADDDELVKSLRDTLSRFDLHATFFDDGRTPSLDLTPSHSRRDVPLAPCTDAFFGLEDAQKSLVKLQNWQFQFLLANAKYYDQPEEYIAPEVLAEKHCLLTQLRDWRRRYNIYSEAVLVNSSPAADGPETTNSKNAHIALQIQYEASTMLQRSRIPARPEVFGAVPNLAGRGIVRLCESIMCASSDSDSPPLTTNKSRTPRTVVSLEAGPVSVLFLLAMKCSDQHVVDRAAELLAASWRRESLYDSHKVGVLIQQLQVVKAQRKLDAGYARLGSVSDDSLEFWCGDLIMTRGETSENA